VSRAPRLALVLYALALGIPGLASIPAVDRDEAYFAQAARQMLESGDYVDIRFQDAPRYQKPALTYWLQAASASVVGGPRHDRIWAYRLPSLLAIVVAVLVLFEIGLVFLDARAALNSAALVAGTLLLQTQAHQARADALLFLSVATCLWPLARALRSIDERAPDGPAKAALPFGLVAVFWGSLAAGLLVKGPVAPAIVLLSAGSLAIAVQRTDWLKLLRPRLGLAILALLALPWPAAMLVLHGSAFFAGAALGDLLPKLIGAQESHGAPPLSYLALLPLSFWPATLLLPQALRCGWQRRGEPVVKFCLAWWLPSWLLFELVPTKLPHYVLPLLPAIALLAAAGMPDQSRPAPGSARLGAVAFALIGIALAAGGVVATARLGSGPDFATCAAAALLLCAVGIATRQAWRHPGALPPALPACALLASVYLFGVVAPRLERVWVTARTAGIVRTMTDPDRCPVAIVGYPEPSFVFLLGTKTRLAGPGEAAAQLERAPGSAVVARSDLDRELLAAMNARKLRSERRAVIDGLDPVHGRPIEFSVWTSWCPPDRGAAPCRCGGPRDDVRPPVAPPS
jgi:4-amino-4-deoxy-L-arabinose transferase-like glycosyltransferase